ncbi:biogenesis of lysosome-related organelles complex 1 subunit 3-like [Oncorhynchus nerka]|uniref:biogenesis of lysosome-related organelles complex 1 subunit 3-like n=1 Tax=Oncorhynchus nerka TaxID=8023 RepID=UPI0011307A2C|nr:biogenesis of lysosome-related organelles complex 1 subunit 3-like [Oncorhynchus nerka]
MASDKYQIVVQGEPSETDSDDEVYITSLSPHSTAGGQKVPGEASETDSGGEVERVRKCVIPASSENPQILRKDLTPLLVIRDNPDIPSAVEELVVSRPEHRGLYYNTLLQLKLQESNARLCTDVPQTIKQVYGNATKEIRMATTHLNSSQNGIINASHSIRLILDDLKSVSEGIYIITSCYLLPDITIPSSPTTPILGQ